MDLRLEAAVTAGFLLPEAAKNCEAWLHDLPEWGQQSIEECIVQKRWDELNNRFFQNLAFGTGGMRSRTIAEYVTKAEQGIGSAFEAPEHAAVGSAYLNDFNIARATIALFRYCKTQDTNGLRLVIAHDVRHFSEKFAQITARIWNLLGGKALLFEGPRSTPQLSFSVRKYRAIAGIVITASHNPAHDNGYKVYFRDGAQVVDPHASAIIENFKRVSLREAVEVLTTIERQPVALQYFDAEADRAYIQELKTNLFEPETFKKTPIEVVFTPIHGTGDIISVPLLRELGVKVFPVEAQMAHDPRFPTVVSPNPENFEALTLAVQQAKKSGTELVIGTDPDADRIAIAVHDQNGEFVPFTGNLTGALLEEFRLSRMKELGWIPQSGGDNVAFIKTFVTTPLQEKIAQHHGVKCINTLTGFKWIGEKLNDYEQQLQKKLEARQQPKIDYVETPADERRALLLRDSTFFAFGGEESYGYLASNNVRDKDANAAALMICELYAFLRQQGKTLIDFRDELYQKYGYYAESQINLYFEGATGAQKIQNILTSYSQNPPKEIHGVPVAHVTDFTRDTIYDADGKQIPSQSFFILDLADGSRYAVRGSGTEPKIKFYLFGHTPVTTTVEQAMQQTQQSLQDLKTALKTDAYQRAEQKI
ncbi:MAG: phospho-sugar mutase [Verrucomicrobiota bacterium]|nr:MAG: phospho-sugar mutase [Verrucomicrobiota bacterium]